MSLLAAVLALAAAAPTPSAAWRVDAGKVSILVPLRPGGAFTATTSALGGTLTLAGEKPARLGGELRLPLAAIETGIGLRNQHLREKYLEVGKGAGFDTAVLSEIRFESADGDAFEGKAKFIASLLMHGVKHAIAGTAEIRAQGPDRRAVKATFPLLLSDHGIAAPEYLGVGVADKLLVTAEFTATRGQPAAK